MKLSRIISLRHAYFRNNAYLKVSKFWFMLIFKKVLIIARVRYLSIQITKYYQQQVKHSYVANNCESHVGDTIFYVKSFEILLGKKQSIIDKDHDFNCNEMKGLVFVMILS